MNNTSRRSFLAVLGFASVTATAAVGAALPQKDEPEESKGHFEHPAEYLAAMQAIGWRPVAMFQRLANGGVHPMGVAEYGGDEASITKTWGKFHAISMRVPLQMAADMPQCFWWKWTWLYLYDEGLREDVTLPSG